MEWSDEGIILGVRRHGESAAILEILTQQHGRYLGLVHGGQSRKLRPVLQTGNSVAVNWRARLSEQLGTFSAEIMKLYILEQENKLQNAGLDIQQLLHGITDTPVSLEITKRFIEIVK